MFNTVTLISLYHRRLFGNRWVQIRKKRRRLYRRRKKIIQWINTWIQPSIRLRQKKISEKTILLKE